MLRSLVVAAIACAGFGCSALPARAAAPPPVRPAMPRSVSSTHFTVWYDDNSSASDYVTQTQAGSLAALAERALAAETGWGLAAPVDDGDGRWDVYVVDLSAYPGVAWAWNPDQASAPASGSVDFARGTVGGDQEQHAIAAAVLQLIGLRYWVPPADQSGYWLLYGPDEWAGFKVDGYAGLGRLGPLELSIDCHDTAYDLNKCDPDGYVNGAGSRWPFYEFLVQRYGASLLADAWAQAAATGSALTGLQSAISARGGTLADVFQDYALREVTHGWGVAPLDAADVPVSGAPIAAGAVSGPIPTRTVSVDHLAARVVEVTRGDGDGGHPCFAATLSLSVALPPGVAARPFFYWSGDTAPREFAVSGSTATLSVPWDTCLWAKGAGYVLLPNPSTDVDAASFTLSGSLSVDPAAPATPGPDPTLAPLPGAVVPAPGGAVTPSISVFGPLLLRVASARPTLRLIVQSNAEGSLRGSLGSVDLGAAALRPGSNDVRFTLPKPLLASLRRSAATAVLMLTPVSAAGAAGQTVTRRVALAPAARRPKKK